MADLARFHEAQETSFPLALNELRAGRKASHWMWFICPQLTGLGRSATALHYGISDIEEARAYLGDGVLRGRLDAIADALLEHVGTRPEAILGVQDAVKLRSCATLFAIAGESTATGARMRRLLDSFFDGEPCPLTLKMLERAERV